MPYLKSTVPTLPHISYSLFGSSAPQYWQTAALGSSTALLQDGQRSRMGLGAI
jgi:hypothetical protein